MNGLGAHNPAATRGLDEGPPGKGAPRPTRDEGSDPEMRGMSGTRTLGKKLTTAFSQSPPPSAVVTVLSSLCGPNRDHDICELVSVSSCFVHA